MEGTVSALLEAFLEEPLVVWVRTLGPMGSSEDGGLDRLSLFMDLVDGVFLHKIMTHIDPNPTNQWLNKNVNNDPSLRLHNLTVLLHHIRSYYQESLHQLIVMSLPDILSIAKDPLSGKSMEEVKRLLLLILGCAVQCERKEEMIEKIKLLDIETQAAIVSAIQEVTHDHQNVLDVSWLEEGAELPQEELRPLCGHMARSLRQLVDQRDKANESVLDLIQERDYLTNQDSQTGGRMMGVANPEEEAGPGDVGAGPAIVWAGLGKEEKHHLSVELADSRAKLRRYRQELEEKAELLIDCRHEAERLEQELQHLKQENQSLACEARSVRAYRDEVDALRERATRGERLEAELNRCKEKLNDVHFYKSRVEELRQDNLTLMETKVLLEEQLSSTRGRWDKLHNLEKDNLLLRAKSHDLEMERDSERRRVEELLEENMLLELRQKQSMTESVHLGWELEQLNINKDTSDSRQSLVVELNEGVSSRLLQLEKEKQELLTSQDKLREDNLILQERQLSLDKDNLSLKQQLEAVQGLLEQEKLTNQDMECLGEELLKEKQSLESKLVTITTKRDRQISALECERQHLSSQISALCERAQSDSEGRVREVEAENRLLHQNITDSGTRLAGLEAQLKLANEAAERLREKAERCEMAEKEAGRLEKSRDALNREVVLLREASGQVEQLQVEAQRLKAEAEEAQRLKAEAEEAQRLWRRQEEILRTTSSHLNTLQEEFRAVQRERERVERRLEEAEEEARGERKRADRLELSVASANQEKHLVEQQRDRSREEEQESSRQLQEGRSREQELRREVQELKDERKRREEVDEERRRVQQELDQSEKDRKQLEKENWRIKTQLEAKETELEEKDRRLLCMEKEGGTLSKELDRLKELSIKAKELERDNKELQKQATIDRRTLDTLREDLVTEKMLVQEQKTQLDQMELNRQQEKLQLDNYKQLESRLEETVQLKIKDLENTAQQEENHNSQKSLGHRQESATAELLRLKDHLIDVEKQNASLQTECVLLKEQMKRFYQQNESLNVQLVALQGHTSSLQEQNSTLHTHTARLQVENSTLSSQSASLMAQNAVLQGQVVALETEAESWQRQREEAWQSRESVLSDHERLLGVHERQAHEYEQLISQHAAVKSQQRALEAQHRQLQQECCSLLKQKEKLEENEGRGLKNKEELNQEVEKNRLLQQEMLQLRAKLSQSQSQLSEQWEGHQQLTNELKNSLSSAQLDISRWMARYDSLKEQHQTLDLAVTKLDNHCELLGRLKGNLEEENHHLLSQISLLSQQNQVLLERSMESKEHFHQEQKLYIDKLNALRRQKEKLEEKIMDQYKFYDPSPKKRSQWSGAKALVKLIKPRKESSRERGSEREKDTPPPEQAPPLPQQTATDTTDHMNHSHSSPVLNLGGQRSPGPKTTGDFASGLPLTSPPTSSSTSQSQLPAPYFDKPTFITTLTPSSSSSSSSPSSSPPSSSSSPSPLISNTCLGDRGRGLFRSGTPGGSSESVNGDEGHGQTGRAASTSSQQASRLGAAPGQRPRGLVFEEASMLGFHGNVGSGPGSADNTPASNSPVNWRDSSERHGRSASLSSDDVMSLSQSQHALPRSSTLPQDTPPPWNQPQHALPRSSTLPQDTPPPWNQPQRGGGPRTKPRPSSPGSEMVTLEQFLHESNKKSPPTVLTSSRDDLVADYFSRSPAHSTPIGRDQAPPTSYVTPTVQLSNQRPGQSVKPAPRQPAGQSLASVQPLQQRNSQSLSRAFSLASADLLRSNGPDSYRGNEGYPGQPEVVVRRPGGGASRERPLSARLPGATNLHADPSCLATPLHHSSSLNLQTERSAEREKCREREKERERERERGRVPISRNCPPSSQQHRGEVAMVTPVRAVSTQLSNDIPTQGEGLREERSGDPTKKEEEKSSPASPDPNSDPQTVWYEYGCV